MNARFGAIILSCLMTCLLALPVLAKPSAIVSHARIGVHETHTRFVFDLSAPVSYSIFTLTDPNRVVIDMPEVDFALNAQEANQSAGLVARYRYGLFRPGLSRVVLDMAKPVKVAKQFTLPGTNGKGMRLVIDLAPTSQSAFEQKAGFPTSQQTQKVASKPKPPEKPVVSKPQPIRTKPVIVIDAGHGGVDPGAIARTGLQEKFVVLDVAKRLARHLGQTGRFEIHMTRDRDVFIPLRERVRISREHDADLFISIHADAAENPKATGAGVYTLSENASDREAAALARRENRSDIIAGVNLDSEPDEVASILIDLAQRETKNNSAQFASLLVPELRKVVTLRSHTHRFAGFAVLKAPDVPSVLVELGFLTNRTEERRLASPNGREKLAKAISEAVDGYFQQRVAQQ